MFLAFSFKHKELHILRVQSMFFIVSTKKNMDIALTN